MTAPLIRCLALLIVSLFPPEVIHCTPANIITTTAKIPATEIKYLYMSKIKSPTLENLSWPPKDISVSLCPAGKHRPHSSSPVPPTQGATEAPVIKPSLANCASVGLPVTYFLLASTQSFFLQQNGFKAGI